MEPLEDRWLPSAGALDLGFGASGLVTGAITYASSVVVQTDGKIVAGGYLYDASRNYDDFALVRFNPDGSLDHTFGAAQSGIVVTRVGAASSVINGLALQGDGKIVAVGMADSSAFPSTFPTPNFAGDGEFAVARYNADGSLDATFGNNGIVTINVSSDGNNDGATAVAIQPDGAIDVGGSAFPYDGFLLLRYTANGTLDSSFGTGGIVSTPPSLFNTDVAHVSAMALQADGRIVMAGTIFPTGSYVYAMGLARYLPSGQLDPSFGTNGIVANDIVEGMQALGLGVDGEPGGVLVQSDGGVVITGDTFTLNNGITSWNGHILARVTSAGQLDTAFGRSGFVVNPLQSGSAIVLGPNGDLLVAGTAGHQNLAVTAYLPTGSLDTSFGVGALPLPISRVATRAVLPWPFSPLTARLWWQDSFPPETAWQLLPWPDSKAFRYLMQLNLPSPYRPRLFLLAERPR